MTCPNCGRQEVEDASDGTLYCRGCTHEWWPDEPTATHWPHDEARRRYETIAHPTGPDFVDNVGGDGDRRKR